MAVRRVERKIRSFDVLRAGWNVMIKDCNGCGGTHEGELRGRFAVGAVDTIEGPSRERIWDYAPAVFHSNGARGAIGESTVAEGRLFRVVEIDDSAEDSIEVAQ